MITSHKFVSSVNIYYKRSESKINEKHPIHYIMRLTAELIAASEQRTNPLGEREIILRGLAIPVLEHLGGTRDAFDAIDLTDNRISRLENFPRLLRLFSLSTSGNVIESIDSRNLSKNLPNLKYLDISYNQISTLSEISSLGMAYSASKSSGNDDNESKGNLEVLSLVGNPVQSKLFLTGAVRSLYLPGF